ncbi:MAG: hypothetical protein ACQR33_06665 [Candidatus Saccharibacteria bacterium]
MIEEQPSQQLVSTLFVERPAIDEGSVRLSDARLQTQRMFPFTELPPLALPIFNEYQYAALQEIDESYGQQPGLLALVANRAIAQMSSRHSLVTAQLEDDPIFDVDPLTNNFTMYFPLIMGTTAKDRVRADRQHVLDTIIDYHPDFEVRAAAYGDVPRFDDDDFSLPFMVFSKGGMSDATRFGHKAHKEMFRLRATRIQFKLGALTVATQAAPMAKGHFD